MARTRDLTWHKSRKCYRKVYKGRTHYLKTECRNKSDEEGYRAALKEWQAVKAHADDEGPEPYDDGQWVPTTYAKRYARWLILEAESQPVENSESGGDHVAAMATDYAKHGFTPGIIARITTGDIPLADLFDEYLRQRKNKAQAKKLSVKQYAQDKAKLNDFLGFALHHGKTMVSEIDGPLLNFYRECQLTLTGHKAASERISGATARKRLQTILKVWRWAYQQEYFDKLPRVLDSNYAKVEMNRPKPQFWTVDELVRIFEAASPRTKLYIALAANCGYTQAEISTLTWEMIDLETGQIIRDRPKTGQSQVHVLWPITLQMLRAESKADTGLCLTGQKGNNLLTQEIKADGNITHVDAIRLAFNRTLTKLGMLGSGKSFKHIRKTSAQAILAEFEDERLVDMFLAHSTKGAMRDHYTEPVYKRYFESLQWLATFYGFALEPVPA